jgi:uncharacterized membrane protein
MAKTNLPKTTAVTRLEKALRIILIVGGIIGVIASLMITIEKFDLLQHPNASFICDLNPVISCGSVMESKQANAFGFMNTYIGLLGFPVLVTIGVAMLAGARFRRWFWLAMLGGLSLGILFAYWLLFESIYSIGALCPYCLSVDVALTTIFWYVLLYVFDQKFLVVKGKALAVVNFARKHHLDLLLGWFVIVIAVILQHFWYYYGQHLHL